MASCLAHRAAGLSAVAGVFCLWALAGCLSTPTPTPIPVTPTSTVTATALPTSTAIPTATPDAALTVTVLAQVAASATARSAEIATAQTERAARASASGTALAEQIASYRTKPPPGMYDAMSASVAVACGHFDYKQSIGYMQVAKGRKFVIVGCGVANGGTSSLHVSSLDFTLVGIDGNSVPPDMSTYTLEPAFPSVTLEPGGNAGGGLSFQVSGDFIPGKIIWRGFGQSVTVVIVNALP